MTSRASNQEFLRLKVICNDESLIGSANGHDHDVTTRNRSVARLIAIARGERLASLENLKAHLMKIFGQSSIKNLMWVENDSKDFIELESQDDLDTLFRCEAGSSRNVMVHMITDETSGPAKMEADMEVISSHSSMVDGSGQFQSMISQSSVASNRHMMMSGRHPMPHASISRQPVLSYSFMDDIGSLISNDQGLYETQELNGADSHEIRDNSNSNSYEQKYPASRSARPSPGPSINRKSAYTNNPGHSGYPPHQYPHQYPHQQGSPLPTSSSRSRRGDLPHHTRYRLSTPSSTHTPRSPVAPETHPVPPSRGGSHHYPPYAAHPQPHAGYPPYAAHPNPRPTHPEAYPPYHHSQYPPFPPQSASGGGPYHGYPPQHSRYPSWGPHSSPHNHHHHSVPPVDEYGEELPDEEGYPPMPSPYAPDRMHTPPPPRYPVHPSIEPPYPHPPQHSYRLHRHHQHPYYPPGPHDEREDYSAHTQYPHYAPYPTYTGPGPNRVHHAPTRAREQAEPRDKRARRDQRDRRRSDKATPLLKEPKNRHTAKGIGAVTPAAAALGDYNLEESRITDARDHAATRSSPADRSHRSIAPLLVHASAPVGPNPAVVGRSVSASLSSSARSFSGSPHHTRVPSRSGREMTAGSFRTASHVLTRLEFGSQARLPATAIATSAHTSAHTPSPGTGAAPATTLGAGPLGGSAGGSSEGAPFGGGELRLSAALDGNPPSSPTQHGGSLALEASAMSLLSLASASGKQTGNTPGSASSPSPGAPASTPDSDQPKDRSDATPPQKTNRSRSVGGFFSSLKHRFFPGMRSKTKSPPPSPPHLRATPPPYANAPRSATTPTPAKSPSSIHPSPSKRASAGQNKSTGGVGVLSTLVGEHTSSVSTAPGSASGTRMTSSHSLSSPPPFVHELTAPQLGSDSVAMEPLMGVTPPLSNFPALTPYGGGAMSNSGTIGSISGGVTAPASHFRPNTTSDATSPMTPAPPRSNSRSRSLSQSLARIQEVDSDIQPHLSPDNKDNDDKESEEGQEEKSAFQISVFPTSVVNSNRLSPRSHSDATSPAPLVEASLDVTAAPYSEYTSPPDGANGVDTTSPIEPPAPDQQQADSNKESTADTPKDAPTTTGIDFLAPIYTAELDPPLTDFSFTPLTPPRNQRERTFSNKGADGDKDKTGRTNTNGGGGGDGGAGTNSRANTGGTNHIPGVTTPGSEGGPQLLPRVASNHSLPGTAPGSAHSTGFRKRPALPKTPSTTGSGKTPVGENFARPSDLYKSPLSDSGTWRRGQLLGQGTFGKVSLGLLEEHGLLVAVKEIDLKFLTPKQRRHTFFELELLLDHVPPHPHLVHCFGSELHNDVLAIFFEYCPGGSLSQLTKRFGPLKEPLLKIYARHILLGLEHLHTQGIAHRDLKGSNVILDSWGNAKLADFGTAKKLSDPASAIVLELRENVRTFSRQKSPLGTQDLFAGAPKDSLKPTSANSVFKSSTPPFSTLSKRKITTPGTNNATSPKLVTTPSTPLPQGTITSIRPLSGPTHATHTPRGETPPAAGAEPSPSLSTSGLNGTPVFLAPEVLLGEKGPDGRLKGGWRKADIWSFGCILVELASGKAPWASVATNPMQVMYMVACSDATPPIPPGLSTQAQTFLACCFRRDPRQRASATELLLHPWLRKTTNSNPLANPLGSNPDLLAPGNLAQLGGPTEKLGKPGTTHTRWNGISPMPPHLQPGGAGGPGALPRFSFGMGASAAGAGGLRPFPHLSAHPHDPALGAITIPGAEGGSGAGTRYPRRKRSQSISGQRAPDPMGPIQRPDLLANRPVTVGNDQGRRVTKPARGNTYRRGSGLDLDVLDNDNTAAYKKPQTKSTAGTSRAGYGTDDGFDHGGAAAGTNKGSIRQPISGTSFPEHTMPENSIELLDPSILSSVTGEDVRNTDKEDVIPPRYTGRNGDGDHARNGGIPLRSTGPRPSNPRGPHDPSDEGDGVADMDVDALPLQGHGPRSTSENNYRNKDRNRDAPRSKSHTPYPAQPGSSSGAISAGHYGGVHAVASVASDPNTFSDTPHPNWAHGTEGEGEDDVYGPEGYPEVGPFSPHHPYPPPYGEPYPQDEYLHPSYRHNSRYPEAPHPTHDYYDPSTSQPLAPHYSIHWGPSSGTAGRYPPSNYAPNYPSAPHSSTYGYPYHSPYPPPYQQPPPYSSSFRSYPGGAAAVDEYGNYPFPTHSHSTRHRNPPHYPSHQHQPYPPYWERLLSGPLSGGPVPPPSRGRMDGRSQGGYYGPSSGAGGGYLGSGMRPIQEQPMQEHLQESAEGDGDGDGVDGLYDYGSKDAYYPVSSIYTGSLWGMDGSLEFLLSSTVADEHGGQGKPGAEEGELGPLEHVSDDIVSGAAGDGPAVDDGTGNAENPENSPTDALGNDHDSAPKRRESSDGSIADAATPSAESPTASTSSPHSAPDKVPDAAISVPLVPVDKSADELGQSASFPSESSDKGDLYRVPLQSATNPSVDTSTDSLSGAAAALVMSSPSVLVPSAQSTVLPLAVPFRFHPSLPSKSRLSPHSKEFLLLREGRNFAETPFTITDAKAAVNPKLAADGGKLGTGKAKSLDLDFLSTTATGSSDTLVPGDVIALDPLLAVNAVPAAIPGVVLSATAPAATTIASVVAASGLAPVLVPGIGAPDVAKLGGGANVSAAGVDIGGGKGVTASKLNMGVKKPSLTHMISSSAATASTTTISTTATAGGLSTIAATAGALMGALDSTATSTTITPSVLRNRSLSPLPAEPVATSKVSPKAKTKGATATATSTATTTAAANPESSVGNVESSGETSIDSSPKLLAGAPVLSRALPLQQGKGSPPNSNSPALPSDPKVIARVVELIGGSLSPVVVPGMRSLDVRKTKGLSMFLPSRDVKDTPKFGAGGKLHTLGSSPLSSSLSTYSVSNQSQSNTNSDGDGVAMGGVSKSPNNQTNIAASAGTGSNSTWISAGLGGSSSSMVSNVTDGSPTAATKAEPVKSEEAIAPLARAGLVSPYLRYHKAELLLDKKETPPVASISAATSSAGLPLATTASNPSPASLTNSDTAVGASVQGDVPSLNSSGAKSGRKYTKVYSVSAAAKDYNDPAAAANQRSLLRTASQNAMSAAPTSNSAAQDASSASAHAGTGGPSGETAAGSGASLNADDRSVHRSNASSRPVPAKPSASLQSNTSTTAATSTTATKSAAMITMHDLVPAKDSGNSNHPVPDSAAVPRSDADSAVAGKTAQNDAQNDQSSTLSSASNTSSDTAAASLSAADQKRREKKDARRAEKPHPPPPASPPPRRIAVAAYPFDSVSHPAKTSSTSTATATANAHTATEVAATKAEAVAAAASARGFFSDHSSARNNFTNGNNDAGNSNDGVLGNADGNSGSNTHDNAVTMDDEREDSKVASTSPLRHEAPLYFNPESDNNLASRLSDPEKPTSATNGSASNKHRKPSLSSGEPGGGSPHFTPHAYVPGTMGVSIITPVRVAFGMTAREMKKRQPSHPSVFPVELEETAGLTPKPTVPEESPKSIPTSSRERTRPTFPPNQDNIMRSRHEYHGVPSLRSTQPKPKKKLSK